MPARNRACSLGLPLGPEGPPVVCAPLPGLKADPSRPLTGRPRWGSYSPTPLPAGAEGGIAPGERGRRITVSSRVPSPGRLLPLEPKEAAVIRGPDQALRAVKAGLGPLRARPRSREAEVVPFPSGRSPRPGVEEDRPRPPARRDGVDAPRGGAVVPAFVGIAGVSAARVRVAEAQPPRRVPVADVPEATTRSGPSLDGSTEPGRAGSGLRSRSEGAVGKHFQ